MPGLDGYEVALLVLLLLASPAVLLAFYLLGGLRPPKAAPGKAPP
jgi:hypothetical protein